jgi:hypothetical protein
MADLDPSPQTPPAAARGSEEVPAPPPPASNAAQGLGSEKKHDAPPAQKADRFVDEPDQPPGPKSDRFVPP